MLQELIGHQSRKNKVQKSIISIQIYGWKAKNSKAKKHKKKALTSSKEINVSKQNYCQISYTMRPVPKMIFNLFLQFNFYYKQSYAMPEHNSDLDMMLHNETSYDIIT